MIPSSVSLRMLMITRQVRPHFFNAVRLFISTHCFYNSKVVVPHSKMQSFAFRPSYAPSFFCRGKDSSSEAQGLGNIVRLVRDHKRLVTIKEISSFSERRRVGGSCSSLSCSSGRAVGLSMFFLLLAFVTSFLVCISSLKSQSTVFDCV